MVFFFAGLKHWIFSCHSHNHYNITSYDEFLVFTGGHRNKLQNMCILSVVHNLKITEYKFLCQVLYMCINLIVFQVHDMELFFVQ